MMLEYVVTARASAISAATRMIRSLTASLLLGAPEPASFAIGLVTAEAMAVKPLAATRPAAPIALHLKKDRRDRSEVFSSFCVATRSVSSISVGFTIHLLEEIQGWGSPNLPVM